MMMPAASTTTTETEQPRKVPAFVKAICFLNLFKKCNFKGVEQTMYAPPKKYRLELENLEK